MENITYDLNNQKKIEQFCIIAYTLYIIGFQIVSLGADWNIWISYVWLALMLGCWVVYLKKYKTYRTRVYLYTVMMFASIFIYGICTRDFTRGITVIFTLAVFFGLYGVERVISISMLGTAIMIIYFAYEGVINLEDRTSILILVFQTINAFFFQYIVYMWSKRNREGSESLLIAINEYQKVQRSKDDFMANVSHEIRTPINTICGMSELALHEDDIDKIKENLRAISMAGKSLTAVVGNILDFSELLVGNVELEEEYYNITSTINDVISVATAKKENKNIELIIDCDATLPSVLCGDEKKLRRVMTSIIDNAIKFTDEGCISINISQRKESYGINLVVAIRDTGMGMTEENLENIFLGFQQVDSSRTRQEDGIGLGLSVVDMLVKKMGGTISIKSKVGKGTTVQVVIPQKVIDDKPIISAKDFENVKAATYIDMEQFYRTEIRDEYTNSISHMMSQLGGNHSFCLSFAELQRRQEQSDYTHIFISDVEYEAHQEYFNALAEVSKIVVVADYYREYNVSHPKILTMYKPFYVLTIASIVNETYQERETRQTNHKGKMVMPDAHVLAVDDNVMNTRVIAGMLEEYKIKVTIANSGKEALELVTSQDYDFIFMDHMMPEMDGVETFHRIRLMSGEYYKNVPIVMLTANAIAGAREMFLKEGFNDYLEKPVERSVLERLLRRTLPPQKIQTIVDDIEVETNVQNTEGNSKEDISVSLTKLGLNVDKGILFCNGMRSYTMVLEKGYEDHITTLNSIQHLFEVKDWVNYTIAVHGIKGAMASVGADEISEKAKALEMAGKENRIDFIMENHQELLDDYKEFFTGLQKALDLPPIEAVVEEESIEGLSELSEEKLDEAIEELEEYAYSLEEDRMLQLLEELEVYAYHGRSMKTLLAPVKKKVEMSDCLSAVEMVERLKNE